MSDLISTADCRKIGFKFASRYYSTCFVQNGAAEKLSLFFGRDSSISFACNGEKFEATGKETVAKELTKFMEKYTFTALDLENNSEVMATPMDNSGILVLVTGRIAFNDSELRNFSQSFVLKKKNLSYYCRNAMLAVSAVNSAAPSSSVTETAAEEPVQAPAKAPAPAAVEAPAPPAAKAPKPVPAKESKAPPAPKKSEQEPKATTAPKKAPSESAKSSAKAEQKAPPAPAAAPVKSSWAGVAGNAGDGKFKEVRPKASKPVEKNATAETSSAGSGSRKSGKPGNGKETGKPAIKQPSGGGVFVLFVKNVVSDTTEDEFKTAFKKFGKVEKVEIRRKPNKEFATGYVTFTSPKTVDKVLEQTRGGMSFRGADLEMEAAKQSVQNQKPKGGGKGKGGSQRRNRGGKDRRDNGKARREGGSGQRK